MEALGKAASLLILMMEGMPQCQAVMMAFLRTPRGLRRVVPINLCSKVTCQLLSIPLSPHIFHNFKVKELQHTGLMILPETLMGSHWL